MESWIARAGVSWRATPIRCSGRRSSSSVTAVVDRRFGLGPGATLASAEALVEAVRRGRLTRREFVRTMAALGVAAPLAQQVLAAAGLAPALAQEPTSAPTALPTKRGGGGPLRALWWQAATMLNPQLTTGLKDADGARLCYEPLINFETDGTLTPLLAQEIPSVESGAVPRD